MSLADIFTGGKSSEASDYLKNALAEINGVNVPTADDMKFQLKNLVQAGVITPEQAKTYLQNPSAFANLKIDQTGTNAQQQAISQLLDAAQQGGLNPNEQAQMGEIINKLNTQEKGANDAVVQRQAERGALTGGETMAAQLENNQNASANANELGLGTAANAYNAMLNELTSAGNLGSGLQGQENTQANTVAAATDAINKFNAAQQQSEENFNVGNTNTAEAMNLANAQNISNTNVGNENAYSQYQAQLPQEVFTDTLNKAKAAAGINQEQANQATGEGQQNAAIISGGLNSVFPFLSGFANGVNGAANVDAVGAGGATSANPVTFNEGGEIESYLGGGKVDGVAKVPGDSPKNDTVLAKLSPGEVVLPRTVTQNPRPDRVMEFLNRIRQKKEGPPPIHPEDTAHVLKALTLARNRP